VSFVADGGCVGEPDRRAFAIASGTRALCGSVRPGRSKTGSERPRGVRRAGRYEDSAPRSYAAHDSSPSTVSPLGEFRPCSTIASRSGDRHAVTDTTSASCDLPSGWSGTEISAVRRERSSRSNAPRHSACSETSADERAPSSGRRARRPFVICADRSAMQALGVRALRRRWIAHRGELDDRGTQARDLTGPVSAASHRPRGRPRARRP